MTNAKTVTTVAAFAGTMMQPSSPLRPPCASTSSMRHRRLTAGAFDGYSTGSTGGCGGIASGSRGSVSGKFGNIGLWSSPFGNDECDEENDNDIVTASSNTSMLFDTVVTTTTTATATATTTTTVKTRIKAKDSNGNLDTVGDIASASATIQINGDNDSSDANFSIALAAAEVDNNYQDTASEKLIRFLKEEAPPVSIVLLNLVAVIWGSQHAIIKTVVEDSDPAAFTFLRFGLASLIASPYLPGVKEMVYKTTNQIDSGDVNEKIDLWKPWRWGIEMGLWMFLGFSLQAIGLQSTTAQRSGFLLYLNVKFVPFFAYVLLGRQISKFTWISAFAAFSGTALLALDGQSLGLNVGDIWSVMAAAASAMFILRLEKASSEVPKSAELNATSLIVVAVLSGAWLLLGANDQQITSEVTQTALAHPLELVYLGAVSTALANFIQAKAQKDVPAERASIIYSLDPVYGAFFSWIILGETLGGTQAYIGASIIFVAAATNSMLEFSKEKEIKD